MEKTALRKALLSARRALAVDVWQAKSLQLCQQLQAAIAFTNAQTVLAYCSVRQEPDLATLFALPKTWGLPRCVGNRLVWHHWSPQAELPLQPGAFGILEPHPAALLIAPKSVDLILVPAIACDAQGYRLGYGGGFYDRLLSDPAWRDKPTIGIVFESAYLPALPHDPWDIPLQTLCTETRLIVPDRRAGHRSLTEPGAM